MTSRRLITVGALAAMLVAIAFVWSSMQPASAPAPQPGAPSAGAAADLPDERACQLPDGPMPELEPVDLPDPNIGAARLVVCDAIGGGLREAGLAWCEWTPNRRSIRSVVGLVDARMVTSVGVRFEVQNTPRVSVFQDPFSFGSKDPLHVRAVGIGAPAGLVEFVNLPGTDGPQGTPPPIEPRPGGFIRWRCGPAPEPQSGLASGVIHLRIDAHGGRMSADAVCVWEAGFEAPFVASLATQLDAMLFEGHDLYASVSTNIDRAGGAPELSMIVTTLRDQKTFGGPPGEVSQLASDGSAGSVRFREFKPDRIVFGEPVFDAGELSWACEAPILAPLPPSVP